MIFLKMKMDEKWKFRIIYTLLFVFYLMFLTKFTGLKKKNYRVVYIFVYLPVSALIFVSKLTIFYDIYVYSKLFIFKFKSVSLTSLKHKFMYYFIKKNSYCDFLMSVKKNKILNICTKFNTILIYYWIRSRITFQESFVCSGLNNLWILINNLFHH